MSAQDVAAPMAVWRRCVANIGTALTVLLAQQGVWGLRVHDVRSSRDALRALEHWEEASP